MLEQYVTQIIRISIFIVLIELMLPANKYKKYFDLCKGFVLIIMILNPILSFISKGLEISSINFGDMYFLERKELTASKDILTNRQSQTAMRIYEKKLCDKVVEILKEKDIKLEDVNIYINKDKKSDKFGSIEKIIIKNKNGDDDENIKEILSKKLDVEKEIINTHKMRMSFNELLKKNSK